MTTILPPPGPGESKLDWGGRIFLGFIVLSIIAFAYIGTSEGRRREQQQELRACIVRCIPTGRQELLYNGKCYCEAPP